MARAWGRLVALVRCGVSDVVHDCKLFEDVVLTDSPLTRKQAQVYEFLCDWAQTGRSPPTLDELCIGLELKSRGSLHKHISALVEAGLVQPMHGKQRGVRLVEAQGSARSGASDGAVVSLGVGAGASEPADADENSLPLVGRIAAGQPLEAIPDAERMVVPPILRTNRPCYVLRVRGESMIDDGILDGDLVVIEQRDHAKNGEIVVALVDGEDATLKRIVQRPGQVELWPANPQMSVMRFSPERVSIQGAVVGQMRTYR